MPELPEVETVRRGLQQSILGKTIERVILYRPNLRIPFPPDFVKQLEGQTIETIDRRGKYLLLHVSNQLTWIIHLGMSGRILIKDHMPNTQKHDHMTARFTDGTAFIYHDPRRFGLMTTCPTNGLDTHKLLGKMGPDPLSKHFTPTILYNTLKSRKTSFKAALMDQHTVAGLGNIYVCEALFETGINPEKQANTITKAKAEALVPTIQRVLEAAIASGGSTLRDYVRSSGDMGYFQHQFKIYGRENEPCFSCGFEVKRIAQQGRSTFYCKRCQT